MITNRSDYVYVTGDITAKDADGRYLVKIDGGIMTNRENPEELRGEDICFIKECVCARMAVCDEPRPQDLTNFDRRLSQSQVSLLVRNYEECSRSHTWIKSGMSVPSEKSASELELSHTSAIYFLHALKMVDDVVDVDITGSLTKKPILDMLTGLTKMSRKFYDMTGNESGGGVGRFWEVPFVGTITPHGSWSGTVYVGKDFIQHDRHGTWDSDREKWYDNGYSFFADQITQHGQGVATFGFSFPPTAIIDSIETFFVVETHYNRYDPDHDDHVLYNDTSILAGPNADRGGGYFTIPVSSLIQAWRSYVEPKFDFNVNPPAHSPGHHTVWVESWGVNMYVRLVSIGLIINLKSKYTDV